MAFFAEKVRRVVPGNFTFLVMTDREDLDDQIWRTFIGCGVADEKTPRASSGKELQEILRGNHRFVFSLIHKFNQSVAEPYSERDDIIVISDEAHRTQAGRFARNMRLALPNASFIGFTGTPLFKHDELTRRIFGSYVSRYDFKRSEEDQTTVKLVYESRGEKLDIARLDLNDRIADAVEKADLNPDQTALLSPIAYTTSSGSKARAGMTWRWRNPVFPAPMRRLMSSGSAAGLSGGRATRPIFRYPSLTHPTGNHPTGESR